MSGGRGNKDWLGRELWGGGGGGEAGLGGGGDKDWLGREL